MTMNERLSKIKSFVDIKTHDIHVANNDLDVICDKIEEHTELFEIQSSSIVVLTDVLAITQDEILKYIETVVTSALQYIYGNEYTFHVNYQLKRNQPEVELFVMKGEVQYDFKTSCGVGVLNICSFALRCVCWSLLEPRTDSVLVIDEPFSSISGKDQLEKAEYMVKKLSEMLNLQIIVVSGKYPQTDYANCIFEVSIKDGTSYVSKK